MKEWEQSFVKMKCEMIQQIQNYSSLLFCGDQVRMFHVHYYKLFFCIHIDMMKKIIPKKDIHYMSILMEMPVGCHVSMFIVVFSEVDIGLPL